MDNAKKRRLAEALIGKSEVGRGTFAPLVEYSDGSIEPGLPSVINTPIQSIMSMLAPGYDYSNTEQALRDSFNAAGLATVGSVGGAGLKPRGSIGMGGGGVGRGESFAAKLRDAGLDTQKFDSAFAEMTARNLTKADLDEVLKAYGGGLVRTRNKEDALDEIQRHFTKLLYDANAAKQANSTPW